ncbi:hypothetical protein LCM10_03290 [Rossellomorea aquimaris]|uniref:hypothetical protein n=1 Tax=Rossellomorea aquimaris TaxID=189382 RepID=UPI001CD4F067|nr:hypothetical protein [Rossellomorea aquimaris]MCA1054000.1 hypothetical protein [Rossellomorea aquimaris]
MKYIWAIVNMLMPVVILFLAFATWIGYIAEELPDNYDWKWMAIFITVIGYIMQFTKKMGGILVIITGLFLWFML